MSEGVTLGHALLLCFVKGEMELDASGGRTSRPWGGELGVLGDEGKDATEGVEVARRAGDL